MRISTLNVDEGLRWDDVADKLFYIDDFAAVKRYVLDAEESLRKNFYNLDVY